MSTGGAAVLLGAQAAFQLGLAAGAPWGRAAYGGGHPGRLPAHLRRTSAAAAAVYAGVAVVVAADVGPPRRRRAALGALAVAMAIATAANLVSPSTPERLLWGPWAAVTAVAAWRARPVTQMRSSTACQRLARTPRRPRQGGRGARTGTRHQTFRGAPHLAADGRAGVPGDGHRGRSPGGSRNARPRGESR